MKNIIGLTGVLGVVLFLMGCSSGFKPRNQHEAALLARSQRAHSASNESGCGNDLKPSDHSFKTVDRDGNKAVTMTEFNCKAIQWFAVLDQDRSRHVEIDKEVHSRHHAKLKHPSHKDGKLSIIAFMSRMDQGFRDADLDHNGTLSEKEFSPIQLAGMVPSKKGVRR